MERLILFRHGKAEANAPTGQDFDRPLAARGLRDAAAIGAALARSGIRPDVALVSPSVRTRQTWEQAKAEFPGTDEAFPQALYNADADAIWNEAEAHDGTVVVVAHNPGLHELTLSLMIEAGAPAREMGEVQRKFPPGTAAVFAIDEAGRPGLEGLYYPEREA